LPPIFLLLLLLLLLGGCSPMQCCCSSRQRQLLPLVVLEGSRSAVGVVEPGNDLTRLAPVERVVAVVGLRNRGLQGIF
jgi:hypothetical protein